MKIFLQYFKETFNNSLMDIFNYVNQKHLWSLSKVQWRYAKQSLVLHHHQFIHLLKQQYASEPPLRPLRKDFVIRISRTFTLVHDIGIATSWCKVLITYSLYRGGGIGNQIIKMNDIEWSKGAWVRV